MRHLPWLLFMILIMGMLGSSLVEGQAARPTAKAPVPVRALASDARRSSQLICTLSAFYTVNAASRVGSETNLDGRGILTCHNDAGFTTETPVLADLRAEIPKNLTTEGEIAISGNTSPFVVPRELTQIMDDYDVRTSARSASSTATPTALFRGKRNDLVIDMKFTSRSTGAIEDLQITGLRLHFDEAAPDFF